MQIRHVVGLALAGSIALAASVIGIAQSAPAPAAAPPAPLVILDFKPTLSDLMTMLIQPRHQKLWAAGQQRNWTLAAFQLREMRAGFDKIAATIPKYINIDLGPTFINIMDSQVRAVNGAITSQNATLFNTAFADLDRLVQFLPRGAQSRLPGDEGARGDRLREPGLPLHPRCHHAAAAGKEVSVARSHGLPEEDFRALPAAAQPGAAAKT